MEKEVKIEETITIIRSSKINNVLNEKDYDITRFTSKQGKEMVYLEEIIKTPKGE